MSEQDPLDDGPELPAKRGPGDRADGYHPTKAELEGRITEIYKLLLLGVARHDISRFVAEKTTWRIAERTIDRYCAKAAKLFQRHAAIERDTEMGKAVARLTDLYSRTVRIQDYKTALAAQKEINELLGLYPAKRRPEDGDDDTQAIAILVTPGRATSREQWQNYVAEQQKLLAPPSTP